MFQILQFPKRGSRKGTVVASVPVKDITGLTGLRSLESPVLEQLAKLRKKKDPLDGITNQDRFVLRCRYAWVSEGESYVTQTTVLALLHYRIIEGKELKRFQLLGFAFKPKDTRQRRELIARLLETSIKECMGESRESNISHFEVAFSNNEEANRVRDSFKKAGFQEIVPSPLPERQNV